MDALQAEMDQSHVGSSESFVACKAIYAGIAPCMLGGVEGDSSFPQEWGKLFVPLHIQQHSQCASSSCPLGWQSRCDLSRHFWHGRGTRPAILDHVQSQGTGCLGSDYSLVEGGVCQILTT